MIGDSPEPYIAPIRDASRRLVRELGFMKPGLAGTVFPPSAVHALVEIGAKGRLTSADLADSLCLEKSSISRMVRKLIEAGELAETASESDGRAKPLSLTPKGEITLAAINAFARDQVFRALQPLRPTARGQVLDGLAAYADALEKARLGTAHTDRIAVTIETGYQPGVIGRAADMHARYYRRTAGFGQVFEAKIASELAAFSNRLDHARSRLWTATRYGQIVGTIAIDGQDMGQDTAHLRWFVVEDGMRGGGIGRRLLAEALRFCDQAGFRDTCLWTFQGLDAARRLYESNGFVLTEEKPGTQWGREVIEQKFVRCLAGPEHPTRSGCC